MTYIEQPLYPQALRVRGAIGQIYIFRQYGAHRHVYPYYYPYNPRTQLQQYNRNLLAYAVANWHSFSDDVKGYYNKLKYPNVMTGFNRYISFYLEANYDPSSLMPVVCTGAEINTGTDNDKYASPLAIAESWLGTQGGWALLPACTYEAADAPTFTFSIASDVTGIFSPGMRIRLVQTTTKYFIVTAVGAYSGGKTIITVYGGTDYTLANAAISSPYMSLYKAPFGFPLDPAKWTVLVEDGSTRQQNNPGANTWYNLGSFSISLPIGAWRVKYLTDVTIDCGSGGLVGGIVRATLSNANNSESDAQTTREFYVELTTSHSRYTGTVLQMDIGMTIASKITKYLNVSTNNGSVAILYCFRGAPNGRIEAICQYL